jgi:uncharacterized protein
MLTDASAMVALLDRKDMNHPRCVDLLKSRSREVLLTTWPCFTEAMYLLHCVGGWDYQDKLWNLYRSRRLALHELSARETAALAPMMENYANVPMDLADASLMAVAETLSLREIFSLDSDFLIYRTARGGVLEVVPTAIS